MLNDRYANLCTSIQTLKSSTISPTAATLAVALKVLQLLRGGIPVSASVIRLALMVVLTMVPILVTGLGTPNYPAMLSLFLSMP